MASFVVTGIDFVNNVAIGTTSGAGTQGQGQIRLLGGQQVFADDAIVEVFTTRESALGELTPGSAITGIRTYASRADFLAGQVQFSYVPQNPGQEAGIQSDLSGLGDTYLRFNASVLVPRLASGAPDPAAPSLGSVFLAPGTNAGDGIGSLVLDRRADIDLNGDGRIGPVPERGNNLYFTGLSDFVYICFAAGTRIATARGQVPVEAIVPGDRVVTRDDGAQMVRWAGRRRVVRPGLWRPDHRPVTIAAGALGRGRPGRDLTVSPNHRVLIAGPRNGLWHQEHEVLAAAKHLIHLPGFVARAAAQVTYVHLLFDRHQLVMSEGAWTESFQPGALSMTALEDDQRAEVTALFPELDGACVPCAPAARRILKRHEARLVAF